VNEGSRRIFWMWYSSICLKDWGKPPKSSTYSSMWPRIEPYLLNAKQE
jgi:hypothetical protein